MAPSMRLTVGLGLLLALLGTAAALCIPGPAKPKSDCGGNCPSGQCTTCPCGIIPIQVDVPQYCSEHDWNQACCNCIAQELSSGNTHAVDKANDCTYNVGMWKINQGKWAECNKGKAPCTAATNLVCAKSLFDKDGWNAWPDAAAKCGCAST